VFVNALWTEVVALQLLLAVFMTHRYPMTLRPCKCGAQDACSIKNKSNGSARGGGGG
jgi:hypothetical protein